MESSRMCLRQDPRDLLQAVLDIGELLLVSGAEVNRVEDTISRICRAYGAEKTDVFCILSAIVVTIRMPDGEILTQTRRIGRRETDLGKVDDLNTLSRDICACPVPVPEVRKRIAVIRNKKKPRTLLLLITYGMISFVFSVFFGGSFSDGLCAFLSGMVLFGLLTFNGHFGLNNILQIMMCSAGCAVSAIFFSRIGIGTHADKIMIGNIMLVIPGVLLTTSIRDMINGDVISGAIGFCEAILTAMAVALGFAIIVKWIG